MLLKVQIANVKLFLLDSLSVECINFHILLGVGWFRAGVSVEESLEPIALPVQALHQVLRLAGARQVVILAREDHDFGGHAVMLQRAEPLLALLDRHAKIVVGVQDQRRRLDILRVLQRRGVPVLVEVVEENRL